MKKGMVMFIGSLVITGGIVAAILNRPDDGYKIISVDEAQRIIATDSTIVLLDVRTPAEYDGGTGHLANSILIPIQELEQRVGELEPFRDRTIIAYCRTGNRSGKAAALLTRHGFTAINMAGGIVKWNEKRLPVVREAVK